MAAALISCFPPPFEADFPPRCCENGKKWCYKLLKNNVPDGHQADSPALADCTICVMSMAGFQGMVSNRC
jgi:hypothetical protein